MYSQLVIITKYTLTLRGWVLFLPEGIYFAIMNCTYVPIHHINEYMHMKYRVSVFYNPNWILS